MAVCSMKWQQLFVRKETHESRTVHKSRLDCLLTRAKATTKDELRAGERHYGNARMAVKKFISETLALKKKKKILIYCDHKKELF